MRNSTDSNLGKYETLPISEVGYLSEREKEKPKLSPSSPETVPEKGIYPEVM